ncbi:efflux RND transporter periplasmic adaptor subunit [Candidatus Omnitrophota bacterium]
MISNDKIKPVLDKVLTYTKENKRILKLVGVLLLAMFITAQVRGCIERNRKPPVQPRPVQTSKAFNKTVPVYVDSFGTLSSPENVDIKAQVTGQILEVNFTQGQEVSAGDLLFTIDPREYKANLDKAQGALAEQVEDLKLKTDTFERNKQLFERDLISEQDFETYQTDMAAAAAAAELAAAELELAKINLDYCYIVSPINGLTGKRLVDIGNIIPANTGPVLVNVKRIDELYLDFTLPERDLAKVRKAMKENTLDVQIFIPGKEGKTFSGKLEFIDNTVDDDTGTFALRAVVKNDARKLWAGQFVNVKLILGQETDAVLVAYDAAQIGKQGYYVFVVQKNNKADLRTVTVGSKQGSSIVIEKGVEVGETVVTVGQLGLSPGMPIIDITEKVKKQEKTN